MSAPRIPRWPTTGPTPHTWHDSNAANSDMWEIERKNPRLSLLVYALAIVLVLAGSAIWPWGFAS
ncbi:hypothetical protein [Ideonella paludis]|uniref:Uncharacterized protein n=1 Tax=Ideonella paludis TaxID=1233411 RepID=A0ABS5DU07_9BURK|nr:hypothetical protein [Ideonella paludis]MBQ0934628.1 hypothetical protein [Ideonella paludis]